MTGQQTRQESEPSSTTNSASLDRDYLEDLGPQAPPATAESAYFAYTCPETPPLTYSQSLWTASTLSNAPRSTAATPTPAQNFRPFAFVPPPEHAFPPQTSGSAVPSTASSAPNFAFRPPSEPDPARVFHSRSRPQTRVRSSDSTRPDSVLQTHWEQPSPPLSGHSNLEPLPEDEKNVEGTPASPNLLWLPAEKLEFSRGTPHPLRSSDPHPLSTTEVQSLEYAKDETRTTITVPRDISRYLNDIEEDEDSPYPEVRASVSNTDDPDMPCLTFRMWTLGILLSLMTSAINMYLYLRYPAPYVRGPFVTIISYVLGKLLAAILPIRSWNIAGHEFSLNPGPFNVKEHALICIFAGITFGDPIPYGIGAVIAWEKNYMRPIHKGFTFLFLISSRLLGVGLAGLCRRLFVYSASAIWPNNLSTAAMLNTLHAENDGGPDQKGLSRLRFFLAVTTISCVWVFLPGFLFTGLSYSSFICWIWPRNIVVNQVFGSVTGLGLNIFTFDWSQISFIVSPLTTPFWAQLHMFVTFAIVYWIVVPALYYSNVWNSGHLPLIGSSAYDRFAQPFNLTRVFDSDTGRFNLAAYEAYSPIYLPISFALTYTIMFAVPPALIVECVLRYGPFVYRIIRDKKKADFDRDDVHAKLMRRYPEVPQWCYVTLLVAFFALSIGAAFVQPDLDVPLGAIILSIAMAFLFVIPQCYLDSTIALTASINLLPQITAGVLWPEKPLTNMVFKGYTLSTISVCSGFTQALKLGHYLKVPPRYTFIAALIGLAISTVFQIGVKEWIFADVEDVCRPRQASQLTCSHSQVFYTASIIWGLVGPTRQFGNHGIYYGPVYATIASALLPLMLWWWNRRHRKPSWLRWVNVGVALNGPTWIPPASGINYTSFIVVGFIFQYYLRTRQYNWWSRYNYVLAGALDSGTAIGIVLCYLILQLPKRGELSLNWWGNTVWQNTADADGTPFYSTDPVKGF